MNDDFTKTFFTDESSSQLFRMQIARWTTKNSVRIPRPKFPKSVMVWGGISTMGTTELAFVNGTIDSQKYMDTLADYLLPSAQAYYGEDWRLQQDNATPHVSKLTRGWLNENIPAVLEWPANSPDLSPIENVWQILKYRVEKKEPQTIPDLKNFLAQTWNEIDTTIYSRLIESVPRRLKLCRDIRGNEIDLKNL